MDRFFVFLGVSASLFLVLTGTASAHTTGASWTAPSGTYFVDVGYDPSTYVAGQYTRFDFILWKGAVDASEHASYSHVWVRILGADKDTLLATGIFSQPVGPTTLLYKFTEPGSYKLETSFRDADGNDIAVAEFPFTVISSGTNSHMLANSLYFAMGACIGAAALFIWARRRSGMLAL